jgi:acylphosphatase
MKRMMAVVSGRVQGVSFRYYTARTARTMGIVGWVRNLPDGTVQVVAEGDDADLDRFTAFLHVGSPAARVSQVDVTPGVATGEFAAFYIR